MTTFDGMLDSIIELGKVVVVVLGTISLALLAASILVSWISALLRIQEHTLGVCVRWATLFLMLWYFAADGFERIKEQTLSHWVQISMMGKSSNP